MEKHTQEPASESSEDWITETEVARSTGKSREWVRRRIGNCPRNEKGQFRKRDVESVLRSEGFGDLTVHCNPLRWVAEMSTHCFLEVAFSETNRDLWETVFRGSNRAEMEKLTFRVWGLLQLIQSCSAEADSFSRFMAKDSNGEDIDDLWRRIIGPGCRTRFHSGRAVPERDLDVPKWLEAAAQKAQKEIEGRDKA